VRKNRRVGIGCSMMRDGQLESHLLPSLLRLSQESFPNPTDFFFHCCTRGEQRKVPRDVKASRYSEWRESIALPFAVIRRQSIRHRFVLASFSKKYPRSPRELRLRSSYFTGQYRARALSAAAADINNARCSRTNSPRRPFEFVPQARRIQIHSALVHTMLVPRVHVFTLCRDTRETDLWTGERATSLFDGIFGRAILQAESYADPLAGV